MPMPNLGKKLADGKLIVNGEPARNDVRVVRNSDKSLLDRLVETAEAARTAQPPPTP